MIVWIVEYSTWDESRIMGVYSSVERAKADTPLLAGQSWGKDGDGEAIVGLEYGRSISLHQHEVK